MRASLRCACVDVGIWGMKYGKKLLEVDWIRRWLDARKVGARSNVMASSVVSGSCCVSSGLLDQTATYRRGLLELQTKHLNLVDTLVIIYRRQLVIDAILRVTDQKL